MWLGKHKGKYIVYGSDGRVLIITRYKNIATSTIKEYKNAKEKRNELQVTTSNPPSGLLKVFNPRAQKARLAALAGFGTFHFVRSQARRHGGGYHYGENKLNAPCRRFVKT